MVVDHGNLRDWLATGLGGKGNEFLEHEVAGVLAELVNVSGGQASGVDGVEDCQRGKVVSV